MITEKDIENIAAYCHKINKMYCESIGDFSQPEWKDAPQWQKQSAINGVKFHIQNPDVTPEESHKNWLKEKLSDGWVYGVEKDVEKKTHPCIMDYEDLPPDQRFKDTLFKMSVIVGVCGLSEGA